MLTVPETSSNLQEDREVPAKVAVSGRLRAVCFALILAGIWLRLGFLGMRPLWDDEAFTYFISRGGIGSIWHDITCDASPPLFYMMELGMVRLFGSSETGLRMLSALAGVLLIPAGMLAARQIWDTRAAWVTGALLASAAPLVYQSQEARFYSVLTLEMWLAAWCLWHYAATLRWSWGLGAVAAGTVAMWTHYTGVFILVFAGAAYLWRTRRQWVVAAIPGIALTLVLVSLRPLMVAQKANYIGLDVGSSTFHPGLALPAASLRSVMMLGNGGYPEGPLRLLGFAGFLLALGLAVVVGVQNPANRARLAFPAVFGVVVLLTWQLGGVFHTWPIRDNFIGVLVPAAALILAGAVSTASRYRFAAAAPAIALLVMWSGSGLLAIGKGRANPDFRTAARLIAETGNTGVVLARPWGDLACYKYYDRRPVPLAVFGFDPRTQPSLEAKVVKEPLLDVSEVVGRQDQIWVVGKESGTVGFVTMEQQLKTAGYRPSREEKLQGVRMVFWQRGGEAAAR